MKDFRIPKAVTLINQRVSTKILDNISLDNDNIGEAKYRVNEIRLQSASPTNGIDQDRQDEVYLHELVHWIIYEMDYEFHSEKQEEKFVTAFSKILHQAFKTAEFEE